MDREIEFVVKYGWLHSRGHAKMYVNAKYHCCTTNCYWKTDLNVKFRKVTGPWNKGHKWPSSKLHLEIIKSNIFNKIHDNCFKNVTASVFPLIWPGDLVFYPKWPSFKLDLEIIMTNILSKIKKNATSRVLTRVSFDLVWWPSFLTPSDQVSNLT